jgi:hypothetical protein
MELLLPLVEKLGEGNRTFMVRRKVDDELSLHFDKTEAEEDRVEVVLNTELEFEPDEVEARNMSLLAEIEYKDGKLEVEECELDLELFVVKRLLLNEYLQEMMSTSSERKEINKQKKELSQLERSTHKKKARELKKLFDTAKVT